MAAPRLPSALKTGLCVVLLLCGLAYFFARGPARGISRASDFKEIYAPARATIHGENGYDVQTARRYWMQSAGIPDGSSPEEVDLGLLYPPTTLGLMLPFGALSWPESRMTLAVVNTVAAFALIVGGIWLVGLAWVSAAAIGLAAFLLALAPIHTSISMGQPVLLSAAPLIWGVGLVLRRRELSGGLLLGLSAAFKVQLGAPFVAYFLLRGRWRAAVGATVPVLVFAAVGIIPLELNGTDWLTSWSANLHEMREGGYADPGPANRNSRPMLINLYYPLYVILGHRTAAEVIAFALASVAGVWLVLQMNRRRSSRHEPLAAGLVGVLALLPTYHLFYDATLLALPIAWAVGAWVRERRRAALVAMALCLPFLVPGAAAMARWSRQGRLPPWIVDQPWAESTLLAHQNWLLVLLAVTLMVTLQRSEPPRPIARSQDGTVDAHRKSSHSPGARGTHHCSQRPDSEP